MRHLSPSDRYSIIMPIVSSMSSNEGIKIRRCRLDPLTKIRLFQQSGDSVNAGGERRARVLRRSGGGSSESPTVRAMVGATGKAPGPAPSPMEGPTAHQGSTFTDRSPRGTGRAR